MSFIKHLGRRNSAEAEPFALPSYDNSHFPMCELLGKQEVAEESDLPELAVEYGLPEVAPNRCKYHQHYPFHDVGGREESKAIDELLDDDSVKIVNRETTELVGDYPPLLELDQDSAISRIWGETAELVGDYSPLFELGQDSATSPTWEETAELVCGYSPLIELTQDSPLSELPESNAGQVGSNTVTASNRSIVSIPQLHYPKFISTGWPDTGKFKVSIIQNRFRERCDQRNNTFDTRFRVKI